MNVGNQAQISISMRSLDKLLQEVVITGYQAVKKKDVTAAISRISAAEIDNLPMPVIRYSPVSLPMVFPCVLLIPPSAD